MAGSQPTNTCSCHGAVVIRVPSWETVFPSRKKEQV